MLNFRQWLSTVVFFLFSGCRAGSVMRRLSFCILMFFLQTKGSEKIYSGIKPGLKFKQGDARAFAAVRDVARAPHS